MEKKRSPVDPKSAQLYIYNLYLLVCFSDEDEL